MRFFATKPFRAVGTIATLALAACSGSGTSPEPVTTSNPASNVLKMSVGTANIFGDTPAAAISGINVAVSYRQPKGGLNAGASAVLVSSPTLTLPSAITNAAGTPDGFYSTIVGGPASSEEGTASMTATGQNAITGSTFGTSGGAFGLGLEPFNYNGNGVPDSNVPYQVPVYDALAAAGDPNAFVPWGGPPAFDPNKDGLGVRDGNTYPAGVLGVSEGLDVFEIAPATGTYTLSVAIPANTGTTTQSTTASLASATLLPAIAPPVPAALDGSGGGTFTVTLPAGVTEGYVQITDLGPDSTASTQPPGCNTASVATPVYYTFAVTASGTITLADSTGPGTKAAPTPSLCTAAQNQAATSTSATPTVDGDDFAVQAIGFDYPAFEASYPNSLGNPSPTLAGSNGQSDITVSSQVQYAQTAAAAAVKRARNVRTTTFSRVRGARR